MSSGTEGQSHRYKGSPRRYQTHQQVLDDFEYGNTSDLRGFIMSAARRTRRKFEKDNEEDWDGFCQDLPCLLNMEISKGQASFDTSVVGHSAEPYCFVVLSKVTAEAETKDDTAGAGGSLYVWFYNFNRRSITGSQTPYPDDPSLQRDHFRQDFRREENMHQVYLRQRSLNIIDDAIDNEINPIWDNLKASLPSSISAIETKQGQVEMCGKLLVAVRNPNIPPKKDKAVSEVSQGTSNGDGVDQSQDLVE